MPLAIFPERIAWWILQAFFLFLVAIVIVGVLELVRQLCDGGFRGSKGDDDGL